MEELDSDAPDAVERRCLVSGARVPASRMIRFVVGPEDDIVPDVAGKLPGRGYWVTSDRSAIESAVERKSFSKAAKRPVRAAADLATLVEKLLARRCVDLLGLLKRSGEVTLGFAKVEETLKQRAGRIAALVEAAGSGDADRGKLLGYARRNGAIRVVGCLSDSEIGLAFGRESVVHAALNRCPLSAKFVVEAERLGGFRMMCPPEWDAV